MGKTPKAKPAPKGKSRKSKPKKSSKLQLTRTIVGRDKVQPMMFHDPIGASVEGLMIPMCGVTPEQQAALVKKKKELVEAGHLPGFGSLMHPSAYAPGDYERVMKDVRAQEAEEVD